MGKIVVKIDFQHLPELTTQINGRPIALNAPFVKTYEATAGRPARKVDVPLATQEQLLLLYKQGNPVLEEEEDEVRAEKFNVANAIASKEVKAN